MPPISEKTDDAQADLAGDEQTPADTSADAGVDDGSNLLAGLVAPPETDDGGSSRKARRAERGSFGRRHRWLSLFGCVLALFLTVAGYSYVKAVSRDTGDNVQAKSVEWLRDNNMGWLVNKVERWWYTGPGKPKSGGDPTRDIVVAGGAASTTTTTSSGSATPSGPAHLTPPKNLVSPAANPLPGEGEWQPIGPTIGGLPGMYATQIRPDDVHTSVLGLVVWIDPKLVTGKLYPGREEPGGKWATPSAIPPEDQPTIMAAFNGAFKIKDSLGGYYSEGREAAPLKNGLASLVIYKDGTMAVGEWGRDFSMTPEVESVRQNISLIVDNGAPAPGIENDSNGKWGATLGGDVLVWRSAIGQTADGALLYVASDALSAPALADMLVRAGAVRAMELDINHAWVNFNTYEFDPATGKATGTKGLPDMMKSGNRYLSPDSRDFVGLFPRPI